MQPSLDKKCTSPQASRPTHPAYLPPTPHLPRCLAVSLSPLPPSRLSSLPPSSSQPPSFLATPLPPPAPRSGGHASVTGGRTDVEVQVGEELCRLP
eukprot:388591-Rhodomonas_salina.1